MKKRLTEILEVKHLISLMVTIVILFLVVFLVISNRDKELVNNAIAIINNAFSIILGYLFGRQKHLDVNNEKEDK